ncbi:hypothetical protein PISMIDRAFT_10286 [Pisolithus microcarpus 441]|uniref:Unplaced genomic scaffold scaffold_33, whole genome shotgun sequence n=1 Tax=Pisolithus microcarpus 441 TaxID=765257 RepID=A0A0C9ZEC8_9AGAM|nr:hypothetical protein PISMIDRAFT_10286 [Pisolithus microcarpus 441]
MSTSKATTSCQPIYIPPNAICKEIPKRWAKNMEALVVVMREIPDEAAEEDVAWGWMELFEEISAQIEELHKFTTNMSAEVPEYPEDTEEAMPQGEEKMQQGWEGREEVTLQETSTSAAAPPTLDLPPTTPSISQPPPPLFLPSSPTNIPVPSTSWTEVEPQDDPTTFAASLSGDEGDLETPWAWWTPFSSTPHTVAQYDVRLAAAISTVEWAKSIMAELHLGMGQLGLIIQRAKREIHQLQEWWQDNFEDRW